LLLNALSERPQEIRNLSDCDDTEVMLQALRSGKADIDIKAAGTAMRFLTAYLSGKDGLWTITGTERMKNRPVKILAEALTALGADIHYMEKAGFPPLQITGHPLQGGDVSLDGSVSSQYISALLMVAPLMKNGLQLHLTGDLISKPYLQLTVRLMEQFGVVVTEEGQTFTVPPQSYAPVPFTVEADWSAASYWYEMAAVSGQAEVELQGLFPGSLQGDAAIVPLFDRLGVETVFTPSGVILKRKERTQQELLRYDFTDIPDMGQTLTVTCVMLGIPFCFSGLQSLKIKETDRLAALRADLRKFGYPLTEREGRILEWHGERCDAASSPVVATYEDHRMAMSFAPLAMQYPEGVRIAHPEVISKSYPHFWEDLCRAGFRCLNEENEQL
jgi:3-phosphoshikimate 1-carboxyvinyltransferase